MAPPAAANLDALDSSLQLLAAREEDRCGGYVPTPPYGDLSLPRPPLPLPMATVEDEEASPPAAGSAKEATMGSRAFTKLLL